MVILNLYKVKENSELHLRDPITWSFMALKCYFDSYYHFSMTKQLLDFKSFALDYAESINFLLFLRMFLISLRYMGENFFALYGKIIFHLYRIFSFVIWSNHMMLKIEYIVYCSS